MSILYCTVPHFAAALAQRDNAALQSRPLVLIGPERRVFGVSAEAAVCGIAVGMTARTAEVRCPEARLVEADLANQPIQDASQPIADEINNIYQALEPTSRIPSPAK